MMNGKLEFFHSNLFSNFTSKTSDMSSFINRFLLLTLFFLLGACSNNKKSRNIEEKIEPIEKSILFIGNSYTYRNEGVDYHLSQLTKELSDSIHYTIERAAKGKYHLYSHWEDDYTKTKVASRKWDKVVLQEYSKGPIADSTNFFKYGQLWKENLLKNNPATELFLFATWEYKGVNGMADSLNVRYTELAKRIGATKIPIGLLWKSIEAEINLYEEDEAHPNRIGTFLNACLFYEYLIKKDVTQTSYFDNVIDRSLQVQLKKWAHDFHLKELSQQ